MFSHQLPSQSAPYRRSTLLQEVGEGMQTRPADVVVPDFSSSIDLTPVQQVNYLAILGLMRSGTTWIGKVLDSSPEVVYLHEPDYVKRIPCLPYTTEAQEYAGWEPYIRNYLTGLRSTCASRSMLKRPSFSKIYPQSIAERVSYQIFLGKLRIEQVLNRVVLPDFQ